MTQDTYDILYNILQRIQRTVRGIGYCEMDRYELRDKVLKVVIDYQIMGTPVNTSKDNIMLDIIGLGMRIHGKTVQLNDRDKYKIIILATE